MTHIYPILWILQITQLSLVRNEHGHIIRSVDDEEGLLELTHNVFTCVISLVQLHIKHSISWVLY